MNYATELARVSAADGVSVADVIATVEATGYSAAELPAAATVGDGLMLRASPAPGRGAPETTRWPPCASVC